VIDIATDFGAKVVVFGALKNRQRKGINEFESQKMAVDFFGAVGDLCAEAGVVLSVEHNPTEYACDF
jgi:D-psicose/D-tagatose/L-ribulose 3-epimerase